MSREVAPVRRDIPEADLVLERAVLACVVKSSGAAYEAQERIGIREDDFASPACRAIWRAACSAADRGLVTDHGELDVVAMESILSESGELGETVAWDWLPLLFLQEPTVQLLPHYAERLLQLSARRQQRLALETALDLQRTGREDEARAVLDRARAAEDRTARQQAVDQAAELRQQLESEGGGVVGITTGIRGLDSLLGGLVAGRSYVIAARPGKGKTSLAGGIALSAACSGSRVRFYSREMHRVDLRRRLVQAIAGLPLPRGAYRHMPDEQRARVDAASMRVASMDLEIDDRTATTLDDIVREVRRDRRELDLVVIDHARLVPVTGKPREFDQVTAVSRAAKCDIATGCELAVVLVAQLRRAQEDTGRSGHPADTDEALLGQLKGSGALEEDANAVVFVEREDGADGGELRVAKNRDGRCGRVAVAWHADLQQFVEEP
jgi:replicative DNA helicase